MNVLKDIYIPQDYVRDIIGKYGADNQPVVCIEELSELQKELCKAMRGKDDKDHITEEITHCLISISVIIEMMEIDKEKIQDNIVKKIEQYG